MEYLPRIPTVVNKYNINRKTLSRLKVNDRSKICAPTFWRNNGIKAWCISGSVGPDYNCDDFWLGIYDEDAECNKNKVKVDFCCYGGMCGYNFDEFYDPKEIENEYDFRIQEMFLKCLNTLLDEGILKIDD